MSVAYKKDEIVSASRVARSFGKVLADLKEQRKRRVAIAKNNELEAVILPIGEYETMAEALAVMEHIEIYRLIQERKRKRPGRRVSLDVLLKDAKLLREIERARAEYAQGKAVPAERLFKKMGL